MKQKSLQKQQLKFTELYCTFWNFLCVMNVFTGNQSPLQHPEVIHYFEHFLDVTRGFLMSLHRENLISISQKEEIAQQATPEDKARSCRNILIQSVTKEMMPILNQVLKDHKYDTIEEMLKQYPHDHGKIRLNQLCLATLIVFFFFIVERLLDTLRKVEYVSCKFIRGKQNV